MGLFDAISGLFDPLSGGDTSLFDPSSLLDLAGSVGGSSTPVNYFPTYAFDPNVYAPQTQYPMDVAQKQVPMVPGNAATAAGRAVAMILFTIAQKLGLKRVPSLGTVMSMIRKMAKMLSPAAVAAALGIGIADLSTLLTANARKKRRRVNPANVKALRRSVRRLQSFDHLANKVRHQLATVGGRSHRRASRCGTCRRSPCRCK
jgi:hypothetical protein